ncbi:hypothetical protein AC93_3776 [Escherichia coli 2-005-03_S4_C2]|nr:phage tail fiber domain protein [Escherichia coli 2-005-03_S4_C2]EZJ48631.1 hypothetical protein AC93_3776 [Escherichia coli 2-005-03_S4_C2]
MVTLGTKLNVANVFVISSSFGHTGGNVDILRSVKGNTINCVGICQPVRGNGRSVRWQGIRRPVYRFP